MWPRGESATKLPIRNCSTNVITHNQFLLVRPSKCLCREASAQQRARGLPGKGCRVQGLHNEHCFQATGWRGPAASRQGVGMEEGVCSVQAGQQDTAQPQVRLPTQAGLVRRSPTFPVACSPSAPFPLSGIFSLFTS